MAATCVSIPTLTWATLMTLVLGMMTPQGVVLGKPEACSPSSAPVCTCASTNTGFEVRCENRNPALSVIPTMLPENTSVLTITRHSIVRILKDDLAKLEELRTLFLQENRISFIEDGAFDNLYSLELLVLNNNRLTVITEAMFQHLPSILRIDLSGNKIQRIEKRAFLTLPASIANNGNAVTINLSSNDLTCDCDAHAILQWKRTINASLSQIQFNGYQCSNAGGTELDSMGESDFPTCTAAQLSLFDTTQDCVSCRRQNTHSTCDVSRTASCSAPRKVCQSEVSITNRKLFISKLCGGGYQVCLQRERANYRSCKVSHTAPIAAMLCTFCCVGPRCNLGDMGGRTKSWRLYVGLRINRSFQSFMLDPSDPRYIQETNVYTQKLNELFLPVDGGFDMTFLSFRDESPFTFVSCMVQCTTLNTYTVLQVANLVGGALNVSLQQGYLRQIGVVYIYVGTQLTTSQNCMTEVTQTPFGSITWQEAIVGTTTAMPCPSSTSGTPRFATRRCLQSVDGVAQWEEPDIDACLQGQGQDQGQGQNRTTQKLEELNTTTITPDNAQDVLIQLEDVTESGSELSPNDVTLSMDMVDRALSTSGMLNDPVAMSSTIHVLSNLADADPRVLSEANRRDGSASRLLAAVDKMGAEGRLSASGDLLLTSSNVAVAATAVDSSNFQGLMLTANASVYGAFQEGDVKVKKGAQSANDSITNIVVPASIVTSTPVTRIAMNAHVTDKVFEAIKKSKTTRTDEVSDSQSNDVTRVNSHVMAASVVGQSVTNLADPVSMTFVHLNENSTNPRCVFWDEAELTWSSEGCRTVSEESGDTITTCQCDHLTNFALLMDVYGGGDSLSSTDKKVLSIISFIGCAVSLVALLLTLLTYILFKKLRRDNPSKILVNLCIALTLSNLIFVGGMHPYALDNLVGCKIVAVLLHFSLLSSLCWMAVEAFYMYLALVLVFKTYFTNFLVKCSLIGWGIPLVTIVITLAINKTDNYGQLSTGICWLKGISFYAAFVGPVCLILLINFLAFALVLRQILGLSGRKLNKSDSFSVAQQLRGAIGVAILLGLTWVLGVMAINRATVVFYYLFAIFNSLQGLWIFIFYCLLKREARNAWRRMLPCCPTPDDKSLTTSRGVKKAGAYTKATGAANQATRSVTDSSVNGSTATSTTFTTNTSTTNLRISESTDKPIQKNDTSLAGESSAVIPANKADPQGGKTDLQEVQLEVGGHGPKTPSAPRYALFENTEKSASPYNKPDITAPQNKALQPASNTKASPPPSNTSSPRLASNPPASPKRSEGAAVAPSSPKGTGQSTVEVRDGSRPLRFRQGHTLSVQISDSSADHVEEEEEGRRSVADIIKRLNVRL